MKVAVVVCSLLALASGAAILPATSIVRAPQFDSAVIKHDRLGGNFAYSATEAHAYAAVSPVVENVVSPVGVSYHATPIQYPAVVPAYQPAYAPAMFASPIAPAYPAYAPAMPIAAPIAPAYPIMNAPVMPVATPIAPGYPVINAPAMPVADQAAPVLADSVESAASSDDSVSIDAA